MNLYCSFLLFCALLWYCSGEEDASPYCFQFTWLGPMYDNHTNVTTNCTELVGTPCIEPFVITADQTQPNVTYMWDNLNHSTIACPLRSGYVCIKYSYIYNDAVLNSTHFCGKMIEDKTKAVTSGCFSQRKSGHTIETCACRTSGTGVPCNASSRNQFSILMIIIAILLTTYNAVKQ